MIRLKLVNYDFDKWALAVELRLFGWCCRDAFRLAPRLVKLLRLASS